jgi:hypothetical protein
LSLLAFSPQIFSMRESGLRFYEINIKNLQP